ncbi:MAG: response regulator transcription factor [Paracoccus sp. (in: a-proteobacteria)]
MTIGVMNNGDERTRIIIANTNPAFHNDLREIVRQLHPEADVIVMAASDDDNPVPSVSMGTSMLKKLSARQREVVTLLVKGQTNKEIARSLKISPSTVRVHVSAVLRTLGVSTRTAAAAMLASTVEKADSP